MKVLFAPLPSMAVPVMTGVPSIRSAPEICSTGPSGVLSSTRSSRTEDSPISFGRNGERVANTPMRLLPPSLGGRTVGDQPSRTAAEKLPDQPQMREALYAAQRIRVAVFRLEYNARRYVRRARSDAECRIWWGNRCVSAQ